MVYQSGKKQSLSMKKEYKTGLIIGKFYPFHAGHRFLIETGLKSVQKLTVIVCQSDRYKIPAGVRSRWIKKTFPIVDVKIFYHSASLDSDSPDISIIWADITKKFLGFTPDIVFSSEIYGEYYSKYMGSKHSLVDLERKNFPISGTKIRSDVYENWRYLPDATKSFFTQKIVILGAESTGTTTLSRDLAKHYGTVWAPEYGRLYYEGRMFSKNQTDWSTDEFIHIAKSQNLLENALLKKANKLLICDTDAFATTLWHERYVGNESLELSQVVKKEKPLLCILTDIDIPFVQDGTRDGEHIRTNMHNRFIERLGEEGTNYIIVSGSKEKRLADSIAEIEKSLSIFLQPISP